MQSTLLTISLFTTFANAAGPMQQWTERRDAFRETLIANERGSICDWAHFSLITWSSYIAADRQGELHEWSSGQVNACRHAVWQYQLTRAFGGSVAEALGDTQEEFSTNPADSLIDQHNNRAARAMYRFHQAQAIPLGDALGIIVQAIDSQDELYQVQTD